MNREEKEFEYDSFEEFEAYLTNHHVDKTDDFVLEEEISDEDIDENPEEIFD